MIQVILEFINSTGIAHISLGQLGMIIVSCILFYLAIAKGFEPLLLIPIAFGMLLANLPLAGIMASPETLLYIDPIESMEQAQKAQEGIFSAHMKTNLPGGLIYYLSMGNKLGIFPPLIFMGVGAMTDFAPLIANPKSLLLGAAAQFGIFVTMVFATAVGFSLKEAASIGIIGAADGPTSIIVSSILAPNLLGPISVAAYSYMALVPIIQPPVVKLLTSRKERLMRMSSEANKKVSKTALILFPIMVTILAGLIAPSSLALIGFLMFGNLIRECGVLNSLSQTAQKELANLVTILLGITIASTMTGERFVTIDTIKILGLGIFAFVFDTAGGVLFAKAMNLFLKEDKKINPMVGACGISAFPMSARVIHSMGQKEDPHNFLLMPAISANVGGQIGSVIVGGIILMLVPLFA